MSQPPCNDDPEREDPLVTLTGRLPLMGREGQGEEVMVTVWWDGTGEIAFRSTPADTWGQPYPLGKTD